ncbi:hypothetical protein O5282_26870 [Escherichia coli]|nr:hypothetical protein [Escherichia coli]
MLEAGKRLVILKENEPHGEYVQIVKEQLNLEPRIAQKMAQAALEVFISRADIKSENVFAFGKIKTVRIDVRG